MERIERTRAGRVDTEAWWQISATCAGRAATEQETRDACAEVGWVFIAVVEDPGTFDVAIDGRAASNAWRGNTVVRRAGDVVLEIVTP